MIDIYEFQYLTIITPPVKLIVIVFIVFIFILFSFLGTPLWREAKNQD